MSVQLVPIKINDEISKKYFAVTDFEKTDEPYSIVTDRYQLVPHETVIESIDKAISLIDSTLEYNTEDLNTKSAYVKNGARLYRRYTFPSIELEVTEGDIIRCGIVCRNSYDKSCQFFVELKSSRLACWNDLPQGYTFSGLSGKHTKGLDINSDSLAENISSAINTFKDNGDIWRQWHKKKVSTSLIPKIIDTIFESQKHKDAAVELHNLLQRKETSLWVIFNLLTRITTHEMSYDLACRFDSIILNTIKQLNK